MGERDPPAGCGFSPASTLVTQPQCQASLLPLAPAQPLPKPTPNSIPPGRPGCPWSSPVLRKPRHTGAGRPEHPRGRGARVTAGGPPGPCPSRAGGEAARLPSSARRAGSLLFASPRGFPESTPRPTPTLRCPTPGRPGAGPSQGTLAARALRSALLAPLHCASAREGTPRLLRLEERPRPSAHGFGVECSWSRRQPGDQGQRERPGARGEQQHTVRARSTLPSRAGRTLSFFPGKREGAGFALLRARRSFVWQLPGTRVQAGADCAQPAAPSPPLQAGLQRETRRHALPPLLLLLDAGPSAAARVLLPKRWNRAPPARGDCGGSVRAQNRGEPRGASWGTWERPGESARDKNCRAWCAYNPEGQEREGHLPSRRNQTGRAQVSRVISGGPPTRPGAKGQSH